MKDIFGYYKIKNVGVSDWISNTIFIKNKVLLLSKLLIDPINVVITDTNKKNELNHINIHNNISFIDKYMIDEVELSFLDSDNNKYELKE